MSSTYVGTEEPAGAVIWGFSVNKAFWNMVQDSQENTFLQSRFNEVSGLEVEVFRNIYFVEHLLMAASELY